MPGTTGQDARDTVSVNSGGDVIPCSWLVPKQFRCRLPGPTRRRLSQRRSPRPRQVSNIDRRACAVATCMLWWLGVADAKCGMNGMIITP